jgi:hypothetical protein
MSLQCIVCSDIIEHSSDPEALEALHHALKAWQGYVLPPHRTCNVALQ